jgi:cyanate lyase
MEGTRMNRNAMDITRELDPRGDRVKGVLSGKFLPYKTY